MKWINRLYIIFVGIILSLTVGFGVAAFYPQPVGPQYPIQKTAPIPSSCYDTATSTSSPDCKKLIQEQKLNETKSTEEAQKYEKESRTFNEIYAGYTRTAIFFGVTLGALFAILGIGLIKKSRLVANGLLFAGVLTAILTRLLISLASLGASTTGAKGADILAFVEFGVLVVLSLTFLIVGTTTLSDREEN